MRVPPYEITPPQPASLSQKGEENRISGWTLPISGFKTFNRAQDQGGENTFNRRNMPGISRIKRFSPTQRLGSRGGFEATSKLSVCVVLAIWALTLPMRIASASDKPFNGPANWGGSGLLETPNARVLDDGDMRFGYSHADPYNQLVLNLGVLPRVEFNLRYTEINDIPSGLGSDYGDYKDKAFDVKLQLVKESRRFPAIAVGLQDFHGTELFRAQYLTISRQIYPLDVTIGLGRERLKGQAELPFWDEVGLFGGLEWAITNRFSAMVEYSPVEYEKDPSPIRTTDEGAASPWNFGLKAKITSGLSLGLSYQRGDTVGLMAHWTFSMGKPILPKRPDPPNWEFLIHDPNRRPTPRQRAEYAFNEIIKTNKYRDIYVYQSNDSLICEMENVSYLSNAKAVGRVMRILLRHTGPDITTLTVRLKRRGVRVLSVSAAPRHLRDYLTGKLNQSLFKDLLDVKPADANRHSSNPQAEQISETGWISDYGIKPTIETFFNDPTGALKTRWSLEPYATLQTWKGNAWIARVNVPIASDISSETETVEDAVRSDAWKYAGSSTNLEQLMVDQVLKLTDRTYGRLSVGYLERMYAGAGGELLHFAGDGRIALGLSGDHVTKREPDTLFELQDFDSYTLLGNIYYYYSPLNVTLQTQAGRFLGGDEGFRFVFSRQYDTGARVGFWYSLTDTSDFTGFNEDYNDKGMYLQIPLGMFTDRHTQRQLDYRMSPWTRDVGVVVHHWQDLYHFGADLTPARFFDDLEQFAK